MKAEDYKRLQDTVRRYYEEARNGKEPYGCIDQTKGVIVIGAVADLIGEPKAMIDRAGQAHWFLVNCTRRPIPFEYHATAQDQRFEWTDPADATTPDRAVIEGNLGAKTRGVPEQLPVNRSFIVKSVGFTSVVTQCQYHSQSVCRFKFKTSSPTPTLTVSRADPEPPDRGSPIADANAPRASEELAHTIVQDSANPGSAKTLEQIATVVEVDLIGYSDVARTLEENTSATIVLAFNDQIQAFIDTALSAISISRSEVVRATTGDGAILIFDQPRQAHDFAVALHQATASYNSSKTIASAYRSFRVGAATGQIARRSNDIAGIAIANAVRLETACQPAGILIDDTTFRGLPNEIQILYGDSENIAGKRKESIPARRFPRSPVPGSQTASPSIADVLDAFDRLNPRDQVDRVMILIQMPQEHRPSKMLAIGKRQDEILDWAAGKADGISLLYEALRSMLSKQAK